MTIFSYGEHHAIIVALRRYVRYLETNQRRCPDDKKSQEKYKARISEAMGAHNKLCGNSPRKEAG